MEDRSSRFLNYLLTNKRLTREQRKEISQLLVRDLSEDTEQESNVSINDESIPKARVHDVKPVFDFLHLFTEKEALKYTTHTWDRSSSDPGKYCFTSYSEFKTKYEKILRKKKNNIYPYSEELWKLTQNFLLNDDAKYGWSEHQIKIGYNTFVEQWMQNNPEEQPMAMPLSAFPSDMRPGPIKKSTLSSFSDVVDIFKRCIEFRDDDLFFMVRKVFKKKGFNIDKNKMETLKGVVFYTYTEGIKQVLEQIAGNIFLRPEHPDIEICCHKREGQLRDEIILEILQIGSFSNKPITDEKVLGKNEDSTFHHIVKTLKNLCDFSVESTFRDKDDAIKPFRINYLVSDEEKPLFQEIPESDCKGYKSILTFYKYK